MFVYRPPQENNEYEFFNELNETLSKVVNSYENINLVGDLDKLKVTLIKTEITIYLTSSTLSYIKFDKQKTMSQKVIWYNN